MTDKNVIKVVIDGKVLRLGGYESEEYLQNVATYVNKKISEFEALPGYRRMSPDFRSALLSINIADDLFKAKQQAEKLEEDLAVLNKELYDIRSRLIEESLEGEGGRTKKVMLVKKANTEE